MSLLRQWFDRLTLYLPVLLMGALAMSTYWLVRTTPPANIPAPVAKVEHLPDYFMRQFAIKTFAADGKLKSEVSGAEARHFPDTDTLEIDQVQIRSFDEAGKLTTASAQRALSNGDGTDVQLLGAARVVRAATLSALGQAQPELTFAGEYLHAFLTTERVTSNKPVVLTRGADRFTADRMDFDNQQRVIQLNGRVRGFLAPSAKP